MNCTIASGKTLRITGIKFASDDTSVTTQTGVIKVTGGSNSLRVDHCHFATKADGSVSIGVFGTGAGLSGVIDHNYFDSPPGGFGPCAMYLQNGSGTGDASFATADDFGTDKFLFVEDNKWSNGLFGDANTGGQRFVYRYNTMSNAALTGLVGYIANHGMTNGSGRSTRALEFYGNNVSFAGGTGVNFAPIPFNGGTGLVWGNTISQYRYVIAIDYTRGPTATNAGVWTGLIVIMRRVRGVIALELLERYGTAPAVILAWTNRDAAGATCSLEDVRGA